MEALSRTTSAAYSFKQQLFKEIAEFRELSNAWDGHRGLPLMESNYLNAVSLLNSLREESVRRISDFFPNPSGTLSIIWEKSDSERISLEIGGSTFSYYCKSASDAPHFYNANPFNSESFRKLDELIYQVI